MIGRGKHMPGWSPQIANELIRLAAVDGKAFEIAAKFGSCANRA
jgi:hypothetical protein